MRVLHVHSGNLYGGVETLLRTLAEQRDLCPQMEPEFALCFEGRLSRELESSGARLHMLGEVRTSRPTTVLRARKTLRKLLRDEGFDLVICHGAWSQAVFGPAVRSTKTTQVFWLHDAARGSHWVERWAKMSRPNAVVCNSHYTASTLSKLYSRMPSEVVYCPVEARRKNLTGEECANLRSELSTSDDATVIVQISRMESWKGHELLLEALALLGDCPDVVAWFVGGAQRPEELAYVENLQKRANRLGIAERVRFAGERRDIPVILAAADIFCQPNKLPEPFGISFIEALFAGLPVVSTSLGGAREIVDSTCGLLTTPNSAEELASAIRHLTKELPTRKNLGNAGPARAALLCDPFTQLQKLHGVLKRFTEPQLSDECVSLPVRV